MATLKEIFEDVRMINPKVNYISSIGQYVDANAEQLADFVLNRIVEYIPQDSLAMKVIRENKKQRWSEKQLWVIAYELEKNAEYCEALDKTNESIRINEERRRAARADRRHRRAEREKKNAEMMKKYEEISSCGSKRVFHATFGEGEVIDQDDNTIVVNFNGIEKKLLKKFAPIKFIA